MCDHTHLFKLITSAVIVKSISHARQHVHAITKQLFRVRSEFRGSKPTKFLVTSCHQKESLFLYTLKKNIFLSKYPIIFIQKLMPGDF